MLKEQLLKEAQEIEVAVELDGIFESLSLSEEQQEAFQQVFESAVLKHATVVAASHITNIAESAEAEVEKLVEEGVKEAKDALAEAADKFLENLATEWLKENQLAVDRGIKVDLFESMFTGLKQLVIEHNVVLPEESVDVVAEMENELEETSQEVNKLFEQVTELRKEVGAMKREKALREATENLTDTQREKVESLLEGVQYSDGFEAKVKAMVSVVESKKTDQIEKKNDTVNTLVEAVTTTQESKQIDENAQEEVSDEMKNFLRFL